MSEKILLGRNAHYDEPVYLTKHEWACGWYWAFGYLGNKKCHFHFESYLEGGKYEITQHLKQSNITQKEWWVIRDLFVQAYALQKAAEVYRHGGHQTTMKGVTDVISDPDMCKRLNNDLEIILNVLWAYVVEAVKPKSMKEAA
jgi:hypothetical protein